VQRYPVVLPFAAMPQDPRLEPALEAVWPGRTRALEPIETGITNRNFRVDVEGEAFVLRLAGADTELLGIDRDDEVEAGRVAAAAGVGPEVVAFLPELGCVVTRFVPGQPIPEERLGEPAVMRSVLSSIRAIHGCPMIRATFPVFRIVERFRDTAAERGVPIPPAYDAARAVAGRIEAAFSVAPMPLTTCHNDLLNANFLRDGDHTWIVDYEYAGMGDPFFDLGNLAINNGLDASAQALLLQTYFGDVRDVHRARLALMRIVSDFREAMWGVVQQGISKLDFDYVDYAQRHFTRLLANAADPQVGAWLDAAAAPVP
jgi:aminoglycoside phosphotransferase (APT) family kinase protein